MPELTTDRSRIGITMGDPAGIGPEIIVKALLQPETFEHMIPVVYGNPSTFQRVVELLGVDTQIDEIPHAGHAQGRPGIIEIVPTSEFTDDIPFGKVNPDAGSIAVKAIVEAVSAAKRHEIVAINTAPINKEAVRKAGFHYPGHTEMLAELFEVEHVVTMFVVGELRIFFLTRHHPLSKAVELLTIERVYEGIEQSVKYLHDLGFTDPVLAVAALNPHAGENGLLGSEEQAVLIPAIERAQSSGLPVVGPIPADAVFYQARHGRYTGVLSLYHDQGHIATKTLDFNGTVSVTLGLPTIRTSVDHGTAFDIAGKGCANAYGQSTALRVAVELGRLQESKNATTS